MHHIFRLSLVPAVAAVAAAAAVAATLALTSCAAESGTLDAQPERTPAVSETADAPDTTSPPPAEAAPAEPRIQAETCDWDSPQLAAVTAPAAPGGQEGDLSTVLVGAWQHTHYDVGSGYESLDKDIRFVFPSTDRVLYCQHVPGITEFAENGADFTLNGTGIDLPGAAPGYDVAEWNDDTMVWINRLDDSRFLLQRR